jgi:hypothetical protein
VTDSSRERPVTKLNFWFSLKPFLASSVAAVLWSD